MALLPSRRERRGEGPLATFRDEMDRLFDDFFGSGRALVPRAWEALGRFPAMDVTETENEIKVTAEVPGMLADDIDISVSGDALTIRGEKKEESEKKEGAVFHTERRYGRFERTATLPKGADVDKATASYKDGVLTINLPKKEEEKGKSRKIQVK